MRIKVRGRRRKLRAPWLRTGLQNLGDRQSRRLLLLGIQRSRKQQKKEVVQATTYDRRGISFEEHPGSDREADQSEAKQPGRFGGIPGCGGEI